MIQVYEREVGMNKTWKLVRDERGVALPLAMIMLMVLTMLTITFMTLGSVEPQISRNLSDGARARQLAESGVEWALGSQLANKSFNDPTLLGGTMTSGSYCGTGISCRVLITGQALPGLTTAQGTFTVTLRNDLSTLSGDQALVGSDVTLDAAATPDANGVVILTSTGTFNGASRTVSAVVRRSTLTINAALTLPGAQADTYTDAPPTAGAYSIDGRDWLRTDTTSPSTCASTCSEMKLGIATASGNQANKSPVQTFEQVAESGFDTSAKQNYVQGKNQSGGTLTTGLNTIAPDPGVTTGTLQTFLNNIASNPSTQIVQSTQACAYPAGTGAHSKPEGLRMASTATSNQVTLRNNCTGAQQVSQTLNLGTATSPAMVYVRGEYDTTSQFVGLASDGTQAVQGYGILVVEDADLSFFGSNFRWDGIVIVTGRYVGVGFRSGSNTEIRGALVANETMAGEAGGFFEFLNQSTSMEVRRSKQNIDMALNGLYGMRVSTYREN
jgi:Tfp pilus assembly protein PilX